MDIKLKSTKQFKNKGKFYVFFGKGFLMFSIVLVCIMFLLSHFMQQYVENKYRVVDLDSLIFDIHTFKDEKFSKLRTRKYIGIDGKLLLYDEQWNLLYASDTKYAASLSTQHLKWIPDYTSSNWYEKVDFYNKEHEACQLIFCNNYSENGIAVTGYALLDKENQVVSGNLFENGIKLNDQIVRYMTGKIKDGYAAYRYNYTNPSGEPRILVVFVPHMIEEEYISAMTFLENSQWWYIPEYCLLALFFVYIMYRLIRKYLKPLYTAISEYKIGQENPLELYYEGPNELVEIAECFCSLTDRLNKSETERKQLEESKSQLLADISHDLKTPLTVVHGYLEAIRDGTIPEEEIETYMQVISGKICKINDLINTFHEYSVLEHPDMPIQFSRMNICDVVQIYFAEKYEDIEFLGFQIDAEIPDTQLYCMIDQKLFVRVLDNIVNNSLRYNSEGTTIYVTISQQEDDILLSIGDDGIGIDEEKDMEKLFHSFVRGKTDIALGSGLGLAITKKIIAAQNGEISLCKEPTKNMKIEFHIQLPKVD